ncbi:MAG: GxxExxY protein [Bacteroidota bacterium]
MNQPEKVHLAQALNYLEAYQRKVGLLINFGKTKLEFQRLTIEHKLNQRYPHFRQSVEVEE